MEAAHPQSRQKLLKAKEVAAMLDVEERTVWNMTVDGRLASFKLGTKRRYRIEDIEAYLAANFVPATDAAATQAA